MRDRPIIIFVFFEKYFTDDVRMTLFTWSIREVLLLQKPCNLGSVPKNLIYLTPECPKKATFQIQINGLILNNFFVFNFKGCSFIGLEAFLHLPCV